MPGGCPGTPCPPPPPPTNTLPDVPRVGPRPASRVAVEADLADWDDTLRALLIHGLRPYQPVVWLAEGLLGYLPEAAMATQRGTAPATPIPSCPQLFPRRRCGRVARAHLTSQVHPPTQHHF